MQFGLSNIEAFFYVCVRNKFLVIDSRAMFLISIPFPVFYSTLFRFCETIFNHIHGNNNATNVSILVIVNANPNPPKTTRNFEQKIEQKFNQKKNNVTLVTRHPKLTIPFTQIRISEKSGKKMTGCYSPWRLVANKLGVVSTHAR